MSGAADNAGAESGGSGGSSGSGAGAGQGGDGEGGEGAEGASGGAAGEDGGGASGMGGSGGELPAFEGCTPNVSPQIAAYLAARASSNWAAVHREAGVTMHGCSGAATPAACLATYPRALGTAFGASWETVAGGVSGAQIRILRTLTYSTSYRTRSSADGRFLAHGGAIPGPTSFAFVDLERSVDIPTDDAQYQPAFLPDLSGFVVQAGGAVLCSQAVLTASPTALTLNEPGCSSASDGLEVSVAATAEGNYFSVSGNFQADDGGHIASRTDTLAGFNDSSDVAFRRYVYTGEQFEPSTLVRLVTPRRGDPTISPTGGLLATRVAPATGSTLRTGGYSLEGISYELLPSLALTQTPLARYCVHGGTPTFSYDERWLAYHHYIGDADAVALGFSAPADPSFAQYRTLGAANVYLIDLPTGAVHRVTNMAPGQYALYPHFRSDGWLYFLVRDTNTDTEHIAAANAALLAE
jgi:hypothetical protein